MPLGTTTTPILHFFPQLSRVTTTVIQWHFYDNAGFCLKMGLKLKLGCFLSKELLLQERYFSFLAPEEMLAQSKIPVTDDMAANGKHLAGDTFLAKIRFVKLQYKQLATCQATHYLHIYWNSFTAVIDRTFPIFLSPFMLLAYGPQKLIFALLMSPYIQWY